MKELWGRIKSIDTWREFLDRRVEAAGHFLQSNGSRPSAQRVRSLSSRFGQRLPWQQPFVPNSIPPVQRFRSQPRFTSWWQPSTVIVLSTLTLTATMGQQFYRQPTLQVGTVARNTLVAPGDAAVVDTETTEAQRTAARNGAAPVWVVDEAKNEQIEASLETLLQQATALRRQAGTFPFAATNRLSISSQIYLRQAPATEWEAVLQWAPINTGGAALDRDVADLAEITGFADLSKMQQQLVRELLAYPAAERSALYAKINSARSSYQRVQTDLQALSGAVGPQIPNDVSFLNLADAEWAASQTSLRTVLRRMLLQGVAPGLSREALNLASQAQTRDAVPNSLQTFAANLLTQVLDSNLIEDPEQTRKQAEDAAEKVPDVIVTVQTGEVIIRAGETIDQSAFVLLDEFGLSQRRLNWIGFVGFGLLVGGGVAIFLWAEQTVRPALRRRDHGLILCMLIGVSGLSVLGLAAYSLPAVGLLVSSFYGATLGTVVVGLLAIALPIGTRISLIPLIAGTAGAVVSSLIAPRLRSREELALLGGVVGLIQGGVYLVMTWMLSPVSAATWYLPLTGAALQGAYGLISSVAAIGLSPYLEHLFDLITPTRLAELANPNRPLLKRLAAEAPGTFQHTVFVASLAEAAAQALRCNVELVRAGTLYHDIGKMHDPLGFIENQMGGPNKHDQINDPWQSAAIIKKHVTEGLVMARRCRLPKALKAFIPEHQGTMLISYFFCQAQEQAQAQTQASPDTPAQSSPLASPLMPPVDERDFRYDGPIPQSPETGIVMLADSCEAALRSLKDATHEEALAMVNRILKARWRDRQLVDSGLTREHMAVIAQVFVQVWQQYNHKRIAYPKDSFKPVARTSQALS
jgi:putative nucleotidyltransferase with HDIG domain